MAELLQIPNYQSINIAEQAVLNAEALSGQPTVRYLDIQGFSVGDKVVLDPETEIGELLTIQTIDAATKTVTFTTNLANRHSYGTHVYKLFGEKIRLYRAVNIDGAIPDDSQFSLLATSDITAYNTFTQILDSSGGSAFWYKSTYYNATTASETGLSLSYASRGGGYGRYVSIEDIRLEAGFQNNTNLDDSVFATRRDQAEAEINGRLAAAGYTIPLQGSNGSAYTPPLIENIARLLSAGYVLNQDYGATTEGSTKAGNEKLKQANRLLSDIQNQNIVLLDTTGSTLVRTSQVSGWPDNTTQYVGTDGVNGEPFQITMSKVF